MLGCTWFVLVPVDSVSVCLQCLEDSRRELIEEVFRALDRARKGYLTAGEMRPFAEQTGFTGTDLEWQQEFDLLCSERGSSQGIRLDAFATLVNDQSDEGCYCSDDELRNLLQPQTRAVPSKAPAPAAEPKAATPTLPASTPPQEGHGVKLCLFMLVVCARRFCVCVLIVWRIRDES